MLTRSKSWVGGTGFLVLVMLGATLLVAAPAGATPVFTFVANVQQTPFFQAAPAFEWDMANAPLQDGAVVGASGGPTWFVNIGASAPMTWTGNPLANDLSAGGLADAEFDAGGTMSITGTLYNEFMAPVVVNSVLLTGTVSSFRLTESAAGTNNIDNLAGAALFTPTGGPLADGSLGLKFTGDYFLNFTGDGVLQDHGGFPGDWDDFTGNLFTLDSFQFSLVAVPEPGAGLILAGLGCLAALRRRRA